MKTKNNTVLYTLICITGFILFAPVILDVKDSLYYQEDNKQIEIFGSTVTGYKDGKLSWKIFSDYIWTGRSKYLFRAEKVNHGILLDNNGEIVVDSLFADYLKVNTKSKTLTGYDNVSARFLKRQKSSPNGLIAGDEEESVTIKSDELRYYSVSKKTYLYENVSITQGESIIHPRKGVEVDNDKNIAYIDGGFDMTSEEFEVFADKMKIFIDDDYSLIKDNIQATRLGKVTTNMALDERERELREKDVTLTCEDMFYSSADDNDEVRVTGNIRVVQDGKEIRSDVGFYNKANSHYELVGNVYIKIDDLLWILTSETKENFNNEDIQDSIKKTMEIYTDKLVFKSDTKELKFIGNVKIIQDDKEITCKQLTYNDSSQIIILEGFVRVIKDEEDRIETEYLELNLETEEFYAKSGVLTEFKINKKESVETSNNSN
jgi:lipopolysaccharide assembly outer membrane protein LptD (OstA)